MQILTGLGYWPVLMAFSPDGRYLAAGDNLAFHLWDLSAGPDPLWSHEPGYLCRNFCFAPDGTVAGGMWGSFARYDLRTGKKTDDPPLSALQPQPFSPDGRFALSAVSDDSSGVLKLRCARAAGDGWAKAWTKKLHFDPAYHWRGFRTMLFSADGDRLVRVYDRGRSVRNVSPTGIEVFDSDSGALVSDWAGALPAHSRDGAAAPSGTVAILHHRALYAIDTSTRNSAPVKRLNASPKHFTSAAFSPDGTRLATTSNDAAATVWDAATWEVRRRYAWNIGRLRTVCFAPDGLRCAAGSDTGQVVVWDLDD
jgi:WD40 repeat protein